MSAQSTRPDLSLIVMWARFKSFNEFENDEESICQRMLAGVIERTRNLYHQLEELDTGEVYNRPLKRRIHKIACSIDGVFPSKGSSVRAYLDEHALEFKDRREDLFALCELISTHITEIHCKGLLTGWFRTSKTLKFVMNLNIELKQYAQGQTTE